MAISADVMEDWKNQRFIIAPSYLLDDLEERLIILTDYKFWSANVDELVAWCKENNCVTQGMTVVPQSDKALTAFCLRWA